MKWEDNIKTTLEKRTIKPSDTSWNALADRLDAAEKKRNNTPFWWMGVAATMMGILFAITVFFSDNATEVQQSNIVDTQEQVDEQTIIPMEKTQQKEQLVEMRKKLENTDSLEKETSKKELVKQQHNVTPITQQNITIAKNQNEEQLESLELIPQKESFEDKKVLEIVAQINDLKSKGQTVTDADIDALMHQAQKEIAYQSILIEGTRIIDATALLKDVETDLQQSFRNKIFDALKNSYETVKTAVAERNN
ncbi:MAG: hypothetical protein ABI263_09320 [Gelidibacter sp.]